MNFTTYVTHYTTIYYTALPALPALHCTALNYNILHYTALHYNILHCTALHCTALHSNSLHVSGPQFSTLQCTDNPRTSCQCRRALCVWNWPSPQLHCYSAPHCYTDTLHCTTLLHSYTVTLVHCTTLDIERGFAFLLWQKKNIRHSHR